MLKSFLIFSKKIKIKFQFILFFFQIKKRSSLLSVLGATSMQEMLLALTSLDDLSNAMRKAGLQSTNLIFGKKNKILFRIFFKET